MNSTSFLAEFAEDFRPPKTQFFPSPPPKSHFGFEKKFIFLFLQRISLAKISLNFISNFFGCALKQPRIMCFFYGENMFSILSVFQGFLAGYFGVKLRFKIFIWPVLIIYSTLNEPNMVGY